MKNMLTLVTILCTACAFAGCSVVRNVHETIVVFSNIAEYATVADTLKAVMTRDLDSDSSQTDYGL